MIKKYSLLFIKYSILSAVITLLFILPTQLKAEEKGTRFYFGILGNKSESSFTGNAGNDLTNGDVKSKLNPSAIIGIENRANMTEKGNLKLLLGGEIYYDKIDKTITQKDQKYYYDGPWTTEAENAGKDIYTTNFLLGARIKAGFELFKRASLYGLVGLNYWDRDVYIRLNSLRPSFYENNWKVMPSYGFGAGINLTKNFELNFNYMQVLTSKLRSTSYSEYLSVESGSSGDTKISISVITFGLKYKF